LSTNAVRCRAWDYQELIRANDHYNKYNQPTSSSQKEFRRGMKRTDDGEPY